MMRWMDDHGLVVDGHDTSRAEVLAQARAELIASGAHHLDVDGALADHPGLVARAWWGGDDVGFVQESHPRAQPVTVVHVQRSVGVAAGGRAPDRKG